jgi:hypothetical protein
MRIIMADINGALAHCLSAFAFAYHIPVGPLSNPAPNVAPPPPAVVAPLSRDQQRDAVRQAAVEFCTRFPDDWACTSDQRMPLTPPHGHTQ